MRLYWSSEANFVVQRIQNVMSLKWFSKITRVLHLNNNAHMLRKREVGHDKSFTVRPIIIELYDQKVSVVILFIALLIN